MLEIIDFSKLTLKLGYKDRTSISAKKIPKKLKASFDELDEYLNKWINKNKKNNT